MDWEEILKNEGMPAELPPLRCESIDKMTGLGKEVSIKHHDNLSVIFGSPFEPFIREAMVCLTGREKQIVKMKYFGLKTEREIAGEVGVSRRTVRVILARAAEKMKKRLYRLGKILERGQFCRP